MEMKKAYWIAHTNVKDPATYQRYIDEAKPAFEHYQAKFIVRGGEVEALEGKAYQRNVIIEFPSRQHALDCYHSAIYQQAMKHRHAASQEAQLSIVDAV